MSTGRPVVLIAALNWGLGHANRCIPLIRELDSLHCEVVIAGNGASHEILKIEFPEKQHISLPHYNIRYSDRSSLFILKMLFHLPRFLLSASRDFYATRRFIRQYKPALIISDNRYGFRSSQVYSVLLTHQVLPKTTFKSGLLKKLFRKAMFSLLKKFDEVWVPDFPGENNLSGELSHETGFKGQLKYCGPLSRFSSSEHEEMPVLYDILAIVSGPEPQRSYFENFFLSMVETSSKRICIIAGKPTEKHSHTSGNLTYFSHVDSNVFFQILGQSEFIISRSGYSTIMDLFQLKKKALLIPTPGQTEQEYLAGFHSGRGLFLTFDPDHENLEIGLETLRHQVSKYILPENEKPDLKSLMQTTLQNAQNYLRTPV